MPILSNDLLWVYLISAVSACWIRGIEIAVEKPASNPREWTTRGGECPSNTRCTNARKLTRGNFYMGFITPNDFPNLRELYTAQLRYLLSAENQIVDGLPKMIEHAQETQLRQAFQSHLQETRNHVTRLQRLLRDLMNDPTDKKDPILAALVGSGENIAKETDPGAVRDAGLIASAQKVEHYEIASYGSARDWAEQLGLSEHATILQQTLDEEKHADKLLTEISHTANATAV
jgi:ferritin-like metal-binding protein YciE